MFPLASAVVILSTTARSLSNRRSLLRSGIKRRSRPAFRARRCFSLSVCWDIVRKESLKSVALKRIITDQNNKRQGFQGHPKSLAQGHARARLRPRWRRPSLPLLPKQLHQRKGNCLRRRKRQRQQKRQRPHLPQHQRKHRRPHLATHQPLLAARPTARPRRASRPRALPRPRAAARSAAARTCRRPTRTMLTGATSCSPRSSPRLRLARPRWTARTAKRRRSRSRSTCCTAGSCCTTRRC